MIKGLQFSFMRFFILLFVGLYKATPMAQPEQYDMSTDSDSEVRIFNFNAVPSEIIKGKFKGKELEFKKFDGIHQLLSVPSSLRKKAEVAPLGGRVRGSVRSGFKADDPDKIFVNETFSTNSPHINAVSFENKSVFEAVSIVGEPYYFYNNKNFTNSGTFKVYDSFDYRTYETYENLLGEMDYEPVQAEVFINTERGVLESAAPSIVSGSVRVEAKKIKNHGLITAPSAGILQFKGHNIDFKGGGIEIKSTPTYNHYGENKSLYWGLWGGYQGRRAYRIGAVGGVHLPHYGVIESYWNITPAAAVLGLPAFAYPVGAGAETLTSDTIIELATEYPIAGSYDKPYGSQWFYLGYPIGGVEFKSYVWEDRFFIGDDRHHTIQIVCLRSDNDEVEFDAKLDPLIGNRAGDWTPEQFYMGGAAVEFRTTRGLTNVITGGEDIQSISIIDQLPNVETVENFGLTNLLSTPLFSNQEMGDNFVVSRYRTAEFDEGVKANSVLDGSTMFYNSQFPINYHQSTMGIRITNILSRVNANVISTSYAKTLGGTNINLEPIMTYDMLTDIANARSARPVPDVPEANVLDQPGRVKISAKNLDLTDVRIRAEGAIWLDADHLVGSKNANLDCQNLNLRLGSTNGVLLIENIVRSSVERFSGAVEASSVAWQNQYPLQVWNGSDFEEQNVASHYSILIVDGSFSLTNEVQVVEAVFSSEKVVVEDPMKVRNLLSFPIAEALELNSYMKLGTGPTQGQYFWDKRVAPKLRSLTINGILDVPEVQKFGTDTESRYDLWLNYGTNTAYNTHIDAVTFKNSGHMSAAEFITITSDNATIENSHIKSGEAFALASNNAKIRNQTNITTGLLSLDVNGTLTDGGAPAGSYFETWDGVELKTKPKMGDLLGTEILVVATNFTSSVVHWMGEDRGASTDGYKNNAALGQLTLTNGVRGKIEFKGHPEGKNAIYIDYLEFSNLEKSDIYEGDVLMTEIKGVAIPENFSVYFASSNLPEELIDGMYEGRLRWVKEYPGYNSSMPFYVIGVNKTIQVNRVFRQSTLHDSDGDGTANGYDLTPFGGGLPDILSSEVVQKGKGRVKITWMGIPDSIYHIEFKDDLGENEWKILKKYHYDGLSVKTVSVEDRVTGSPGHRFYRVVFVE
tara:strand:- start:4463 stop:7885 length:3423 start_codon:yes stop_codon:yes gene_type:complete